MDGIHTLNLGAAQYICQRMRALDAQVMRAMMGDLKPDTFAINRYQSNGAAWFLEQDGEPVAMFGLELLNDKCMVAWLCCTDSMRSFKKLVRFSRTVALNADGNGIARIEAHVLSDWVGAVEFAKRLGFEFEGTRRKCGTGGESFHVFARISS